MSLMQSSTIYKHTKFYAWFTSGLVSGSVLATCMLEIMKCTALLQLNVLVKRVLIATGKNLFLIWVFKLNCTLEVYSNIDGKFHLNVF